MQIYVELFYSSLQIVYYYLIDVFDSVCFTDFWLDFFEILYAFSNVLQILNLGINL